MPTNTLNFGNLLLPILRKVYGDAYAEYTEEYSTIFEMDTSDRAYEEDQSITTLGLVPVKEEGKSVDYDTFYQGYKKRYTHITLGLGFIVTRELFEDAQYRNIRNMPKALARSVRHTIEIYGANVLNNAFDTTNYPGSDAVSLCNSSHPLVGGGTMSNMPQIAADLDITSYEQALIDISLNYVDDRGLKILARPKKMIIHPANSFQAQMILKSSGLPDTANNNMNPAMGTMPGGITELHWLTDPDAWFIQTDVPNGLVWIWRRRPEFTQDNDFDSDNAKYKTTYRASQGFTDFRGVYGSAGA